MVCFINVNDHVVITTYVFKIQLSIIVQFCINAKRTEDGGFLLGYHFYEGVAALPVM